MATGRELRTLSGHSEDVNAVRYSPEGIILGSASSDRSIRLWNASTGELIRTIDLPDMRVLALDFGSNAEILAAGGVEYMQVAFRLRPSQGLKLWDAQSGSEVLTTLRSYPSVTALAFRPDGGALAVGYGGEEESFDNLHPTI